MFRILGAFLVLSTTTIAFVGAAPCPARCGMDCCDGPSSIVQLSSSRDCCEVRLTTPHAPVAAEGVRSVVAQNAARDLLLVPARSTELSLVASVISTDVGRRSPPGSAPIFLLNTSLLI